MKESKKNICVITSTRAEYGLLIWLMKAIQQSDKLNLQLVVTGTHLSKDHGLTSNLIEKDGFNISKKISILSKNNTPDGIGLTAANALKNLSSYLHSTKPDALILLGDRFEILAAAQAAVITNVPVIHIHGGEISEGASDDLFRHAITKLSSLHFTSTFEHRKRVIQMGEQPSRVKLCGAMGIENIKKLRLHSKKDIEKIYDIRLNKLVVMVTFHPASFEKNTPEYQIRQLLLALNSLVDCTIFISKANADSGGVQINNLLETYAKSKKHVIFRSSFGQLNYLSLLSIADVVIGNSSSGILEAPSLYTPTVNIGTRQKGRLSAKSIVHAETSKNSIVKAIRYALTIKQKALFKNPYDHGSASKKIVKALETIDLNKLLPKKFYDLKQWESS